MDLDEFLRLQGVTLEDVVAQAKASLRLLPGDVVFACGSLVEGLGNERSDLDLYLVTRRQDIPYTSLNDVVIIVGPCIVDVRVVERAALDGLLRRFNDWSRAPRRPRTAIGFSEDERRLLHRLRSGRALFGAGDFKDLQDQVNPADVARHRLDWARYHATTLQIDLAGLRGAGDQHSMLFVAQEILGHTVDGLLAAHGHTNPSWKWRVRQLRDLPDSWEIELPGRLTGASPWERYWSLHRTPERTTPGIVLDYALRIVAFSRVVFPWAEQKLLAPAAPPVPPASPGGPTGGEPLPHLDVDVTIRYKEGRFELLRLNGRDQSYDLSPKAYSLLCLFDGETSRAYATEHAERLWSEGRGAEMVEDMVTLVRYAQMDAVDVLDEESLRAILRS